MKKLWLICTLLALTSVTKAKSSQPTEVDIQVKACRVMNLTSHSKTAALDETSVTALVSCKGQSAIQIHSVNPLIGQILFSARTSGTPVDITYRNFASSFEGMSGLVVSITL